MNGKKEDGIFPKESSETTLLLRTKKHESISIPPASGSSIFKLFRFARPLDILLMIVGAILSILHGACFPVLALIFGQMTNRFVEKQVDSLNITISIKPGEYTDYSNSEPSAMRFSESMSDYTTAYLYLALGVFICGFGQTTCWELTAERQTYRLRKAFFAQLLRQDIPWHEKAGAGQDLTTRLNDDLDRLREGVGCKLALVIQYSATFIAGIAVGFFVNWRLTLVILITAPLMIATSGYIAHLAATSSAREQLKYAQAGAVADETLAAIKTVAAFNAFHRMTKRYEVALEAGRVEAMKKYRGLSMAVGFSFFTTYVSYGLAFWYSSYLISNDEATPGSVFCVFFAVMAGAFSIGNALPFLQAIGTAVSVCDTVFEVLDRSPEIDATSGVGLRPVIHGEVRFENVHFEYPSRREFPALRGIDFVAEPGKTIALVGPSGAGKSSIIALLLRFFESTEGRILVDKYDVRDLDVSWLRNSVGFVSQEPVLFGASILENILYGNTKASRDDALQASKLANAHGFISRLPLGYETQVGERGAQLSGGQKQRLAIARALIRRPPILLLDEATSALDAKSEASVQKALNIASKGRTTIIVAHRLSTIRHADKIYVLRDGRIEEAGNHETLLKMDGLYAELAKMQQAESATEEQSVVESQDSMNQSTRNMMEIVINNQNIIGGICCDKEVPKPVPLYTLLKYNGPEWIFLTAGILCCCCTGTIMPVFAFFYGEMFSTLTLHGEALKLASIFWSEMFVVLACASMIAYSVQLWCMTSVSEYLIKRIRLFAFQNILRQPVGWFDLPSSAVGKLVVRLAREPPLIKGAAGIRLGQVLGAVVTLIAALLIAFAFGWKLALFLVLAVPVIVGAYNQQTRQLKRTQNRDQDYIDEAGRIASECVVNIRTVHSLGAERTFSNLYNTHLEIPYREGIRQAFIYGLIFSFSQSVIYVMYSGAFWMGTYLIENGEMLPADVYRVFFALAFCAASIGQTSAYQQDYLKARQAASLMVGLINRKPEMDSSISYGLCPEIRGKIEFQNVRFKYPSRPEVEVLRGFNLTLHEGKTVALVGASGCGKSTIVSLLERFYQPCDGKILIDGIDINSLNIPHLRNSIGLVTQEPTLFADTIRENLAYGVPEDEEVEMEEIIEAAKLANAHEFIINLPLGYDTHVGERGTQLSGGQKQRIAIARALIKKPPIILLDEATSALDAKSESIVQEALNAASYGRTTLIVAHRLATIRNADQIAVIHDGQVMELGNHEELVAKKGRYYNLVKSQGLL